MRVLRGRGDDPSRDRAVTAEMLRRTVETGEAALRVWRPHRHVAFGRRDANAAGYAAAREAAAERGFPPVERDVGGRAVATTGAAVAVAWARPIDDVRRGIDERYDEATQTLQRCLWRLGVPVQRGEPPGSFCPGGHSLSWRGKVAGLAQHVKKGAALVGGVVIVDDREAVADVLEPVYAALEVPFEPDSVGSLARAGGPDDPEAVVEAIEAAFVDGRSVEAEPVS